MQSEFENSLLQITAKIVEAFVENNELPPEELPVFIQNLYADLFRELETLGISKKESEISNEALETLLDKIKDDKKFFILSNLNLKNIFFFQ